MGKHSNKYFLPFEKSPNTEPILPYLTGRLRREASHQGYGERRGQCEVITEEVCEKVPVKVAKYVEVPVCVPVPHYTCHTVIREVPSTQCVEETYQKCHKAPTQVS